MSWILDVALLAFCAVIIVLYFKRGVKTIFSIITPIASFLSAYLLGPAVGTAVLGETVFKKVSAFVEEKLNALAVYVEGTVDISGLFENIPESFWRLMESTGANLDAIKESFGNITNGTSADLAALAHTIAEHLAASLTAMLGCILVFVVVHIILYIVEKILSLTAKLPVIKQLDGLIGVLSGVVAAFSYSWLICTALNILVEYGILQQHSALLTAISEGSVLYTFFARLTLNDFINLIN